MKYLNGPGSTANVIAALCSVFVPGLGQLVQGRPLKAMFLFLLATLLWFLMLGWVIHIWAILDAALWKPKSQSLYVVRSGRKGRRNESFYYLQGQYDSIV